MTEEAFWRVEDGAYGAYFANPVSAGPWRADSLMGRPVCGLLGFEIERLHLEEGWVPARLTVELTGLADFSRTTVETREVYRGGRVKVIEAELFCDGASKARATCQILRRTEAPPGRVWSPPPWDAPGPDGLPDDPLRVKWHLRVAAGGVGHVGLKRVWLKDYRELVAGVPLSPFSQAALASDFSSPFSHSGDEGVQYINTEATMYLHRLPEDGWMGFEVTDHQASDGVAVGQTRIYDQRGPIGFGSAAAVAQSRPKLPPGSQWSQPR